jgi:hypothetical protein
VEVTVSFVRSAIHPPWVSERRRSRAETGERPRAGTGAQWAVLGCYLVGAVVLTWRLWADPTARAQVIAVGGVSHDVDLFAWFIRYDATAVAHGHLPALVTTALNAPQGLNLMWNTSLLLPGVVLTPVTLLAGPQVSLTVLLTLSFAGSAASLFAVLRRWEASISAAALGGAVYGFSPALRMEAGGHYHLVFLVLPPLIIDALLRIVTGRGRAWRAGVWLGLLAAAQIYISEEILADTAVMAVIIVAVLAASRPRLVPERSRGTLSGLASAVVVLLLACGYPLWVQFHGPLTEHGSPWTVSHFKNHLGDFVTPSGGLLFHSRTFADALAQRPVASGEYVAYLGWPLLIVLLIAAVVFWRDRRVRIAAVTCALLEIFSLGGETIAVGGTRYPGVLLPWHYLQGLPVLSQMLPNRFSLLADGAAAAVLAFSLDLTRAAVRNDWRRWAAAAVAVLAVLPLIPLPFQTGPLDPVPAGWNATFARLRLAADASVLVIPDHPPQMMRWQADTGQPGSLVGGWCIAPNASGKARSCRTGRTKIAGYLNALWAGQKGVAAPPREQVSDDLAKVRPAAIVVVTSPGSRLERASVKLFGPPTVQVGTVFGWRR